MEGHDIKTEVMSVREFFENEHEQYSVPEYQRRYSWNKTQIDDIFYDIKNIRKQDSHILGVVICLKKDSLRDKFDLVDGQQRVTTLSIFLKVMQEIYNNDFNEIQKATEIQKYLNCNVTRRIESDKLVLGALDKDSYKQILEEEEFSKNANSDMKVSYNCIKRYIRKFKYNELEDFYINFMDRVYLVRIISAKTAAAFKLFENINTRGTRLMSTDIIKNFMLAHASSTSESASRKVLAKWNKLVTYLDKNSDMFFQHYMSIELRKKVTNKNTVGAFKKHYSSSVEGAGEFIDRYFGTSLRNNSRHEQGAINVVEFSEKLAEDAKLYGQIVNKNLPSNHKINHCLINLDDINSKPARIFLFKLFNKNYPVNIIVEILKVLETFMLRWHVCGKATNKLDEIFLNLDIGVSKHSVIAHVKSQLKNELPSDADFKDCFVKVDFGKMTTTNRAKYVLKQLDNHMTGKTSGEYNHNRDGIHLEHIIPQKPDSLWYDHLGCAVGKHLAYVHRIGNLTLLLDEYNRKASNDLFENKRNSYYTKSNIKLTKELLKTKYNGFNFDTVEKRSKELARLAVDIWKF